MNAVQNPKHQAILAAAKRIFLTQGYSGASMDAIAEAAPVSKPTLYTHFRGKQELFAAVIAAQCETVLTIFASVHTGWHDPEASLKAIAVAFVDLIYADEALQLYRLIIAEQQKFPELGKLVYLAGPDPLLQRLSSYLAELHAHSALQVPDVATSSRLFLGMLKGDEHFRCLLGLQPGLSDAAKQNLINAAVTLFLRGHGYAL